MEETEELYHVIRMRICKTCEQYNLATTQCKKCGCFMYIKARLKSSECPLKKWEPIKD